MKELTREDLYSLEKYAEIRSDFRAKVMEHKKSRRVQIGEHATLYFEDRLIMQYQVQEMLRIEKIFESDGIQEELDTYNALIPNGSNLKATFMIEYVDEEERKTALAGMIGIEDKVWVRVDGYDKVYPIADEDLERDTEEKTSSVHFLRFEFTPDMVQAARSGSGIGIGIEHDAYSGVLDPLPENIRESLVADFD